MEISLLSKIPIKTKIVGWIESVLLALLLPLVGYLIDPLDPFFFEYHFPWLIIAPVLISLRYGFVHGLTTVALLISIITATFYFEWPQEFVFPKEPILGLIIVTFISSEFFEFWNRKIIALEYKECTAQARMVNLSRTYHLIKGSHYHLEQHLATQAKSLRLMLFDLEKKIFSLEKNKNESLSVIGHNILKILADYTNVQIATIHLIDFKGKIVVDPIAYLGATPPLSFRDPIVEAALKTGHVVSINNMENNELTENTNILAVIPLVDVYQKIWGIIVVNEMPLFALQSSTIDIFTIVGGKIGDFLKKWFSVDAVHTDQKKFENKFRRVFQEISFFKESAIAISMVVKNKELQNHFSEKLYMELRGIDKMWISDSEENDCKIFLLLLPLTNQIGAEELLKRTGISKLSDEKNSLQADKKEFECFDGNIKGCVWLLNAATSNNKILLGIYHFLKKSANKKTMGIECVQIIDSF